MQPLNEQIDSVFSHGLCFCIKNALLKVLHPAALCPEIARTGRFTFHCLPSHNKMFTMFPFLYTLCNALLLNFII